MADAGHPVVVLPFDGEFVDLGAQVLLWEMATALAGALLGIQPFDQPDVAAAKAATAKVLERGSTEVEETPLGDLLRQVGPGDYLAIQAFVDPGSPVVDGIERRVTLRDRPGRHHGRARPRFLHSTGQLHKGARTPASSSRWWPTTGTTMWPSPAPYGFATLERAQADGDLLTPTTATGGPAACAWPTWWRCPREDRHGRAGQDGREHGDPHRRRRARGRRLRPAQ